MSIDRSPDDPGEQDCMEYEQEEGERKNPLFWFVVLMMVIISALYICGLSK